ncbi:uncharacterized protein N7498_009106 [Penicillium cinerascens]|uniref:Uncharacterized protein n=1 Tax=Penicillium cinerascens TaxID=70096 RepID=A0A9W9M565_9EURO|nr:uncharacterized protein N7498_009106 [Penicillium cinerascens]KAJ5190121.1 hypothetical protein N7498_009106 [Penicillium cinerascens]
MASANAPLRRVVTTHHGSQSVILFDGNLEPNKGFASKAATIWMTRQYPAELTATDPSADSRSKQMYSRGSLIRVVDFPPNSKGHNHRTQSLDYAIIMDGEMEMLLDDGSKTRVRAGDVVVQQAVSWPLVLSFMRQRRES